MRIIYFFIIFFNASFLCSQNFDAGLIAGFNFSQVGGDDLSGFNEFGFILGGSSSIKIKNTTYEFELLYVDKGSRDTTSNTSDEGYQYKIKLRYLEVPILCKWEIYNNIFVGAGSSIGFLLKGKEEDANGTIPNTVDFNKFDISALIELGYSHSKKIYFFSRFENSIFPMRPHASGAKFKLNRGQYNTVLMLGIKYII